jgi:hypothetical protein
MAAFTVRTALLAAVPVLAAGAVWPGPPPAPLAVAALGALLFVLGAAGLRLAALLLPVGEQPSAPDGPTRWSAAAVFATALATVPATLLGHLGLLRPGAFLLWTAALAVLTALTPAPEPRAEAVPPDGGGPPRHNRSAAIERVVAVAVLAILALSVLAQIREDRYAPPGTYGFDDLSYHLSTVATWLDTGDLSMIRFSYGDPSTPFYPIVGELVAWVLTAPFRGLDLAARWAQLPFALATLAALLAVAGRIGLRPAHTLPALALFASLQRVFPFTALAAGNDHAASFFTLAALDGVLAAARRRTVGAGLYAGTALGLLAGTKYLGLLFVPPVLAVGAVAWWVGRADPERDPERGRSRPLVLAAAAAGATAVAGGYTYLRNWATTGNPLFPSPVQVGGVELFHGWKQASLAWRRHLPEAAIDLPEFLFRSDLWGTVPPWLLVTAAVLAPLVAIAGAARAASGDRRWALDGAVLLLPAVLFALFAALVPDHRDVRYVLPAIALAALAWCHLAGRLGPTAGGAAGTALRLAAYGAAAASLFEWREAFPGEIVRWCAAGLALGTVVTLWAPARRIATAPRRHPGRAALAAALVLYLPLVSAAETYPERKLENRLLPRWLDEEADEEAGTPVTGTPVTVAYVGFNAPYLYWGSRLRNRVVVVPVNARMDARLYDWGAPIRSPYRHGTFGAWRRNLDALDVSYVVVVVVGGENPERRWMRDRPARFERVAELGETEIWRVLHPRPPSP